MSGELRMKLFQKLHPKFVTVSGFKSRTGEDMGQFSAAAIKKAVPSFRNRLTRVCEG